jgi:amino acid adenylation domain-containing protein
MKETQIETVYQLSPAQQGMLFHSLYTPESGVYFTQIRFTLRGEVEVAKFERAWQRTVERHSILRTSFVWKRTAQPLQVVHRNVELKLQYRDWRGLSSSEQEEKLQQWLAADLDQPFELSQVPLMRLALLQMGTEQYELVWSLHHILLDGWSVPIVLGEMFELYEGELEGRETRLRGSRPYGDYIGWLGEQSAEAAERYWREALAGFVEPTPLPAVSWKEGKGSGQGVVEVKLGVAEYGELLEVVRGEQLTLNTVVQGAWAVLLSRYSGRREVMYGATVSGRPGELLGVERMVGMFINTLPVRVRVRGKERVVEWLRELQQEQVEQRQYEYSSLVEVQKWSEIGHGQPLFETILAFENYPVGNNLTDRKIKVEEMSAVENPNYPLSVVVGPSETLTLRAYYDRGRYEAEAVERLVKQLERLLSSIAKDRWQRVEELSVLSEAEKREQVEEWNETRREFPRESCIQELFEAQALRRPDAVAVVYGTEQLSYGELNERANQLAHYLMKRGVGPEVVVGVCQERSVELVVSLLGILKAGGVYLPIDPAYPEARRAYMMNDAQAHVLLTKAELAQIGNESKENPERQGWSENLAYVMYTSGSTGEPKGIGVTHRNVLRLVCGAEYAELNEQTVILQLASVSFDAATFEVWGALLNGGKLVLYPGRVASAVELGELVREQGVETLWLTSALYNAVVEQGVEELRGLRQLLIGGEALSESHIRRGLAALEDVELINGYGPTEVTTFSCTHRIRSSAGEEWEQGVPIGKPINNTEAYVLDERQELVPVGVVGELYLGGEGLARGYVGAAELTSERFVPRPFSKDPGARLYRTGDLVRYRRDGELEFMGRVDEQLKIRGFRIEPGEVESVLREHEQVAEAVVLGRQEESGEKRLVAYLVAAAGAAELSVTELRRYVEEKLPEYMMPAGFVYLAELPLNANGKVDRAMLPAPEWEQVRSGQEYVGPRTAVEEVLCGIWAEVLGVEQVGVYDNFFELGGHSLLATRINSRLRQAFGIELPLRELFESGSIARLAERVSEAQRVEQVAVPRLERKGRREMRLSYAQQRLWFIEQYEAGRALYNLGAAFRLRGPLEVTALAEALRRLVARHESLRTKFVAGREGPMQVVEEPWSVTLEVEAVSSEEELAGLLRDEVQQPFDLGSGRLLRVRLLRVSEQEQGQGQEQEQEHVLLLVLHHLVTDGWSMGVMLRELGVHYEAALAGVAGELPELAVQYGDYAEWQREWLEGGVLEEQLSYWREELGKSGEVLELPSDRRRPERVGYEGARVGLRLGRELTERLKELSRREDVTLYMTLLAGWGLLLARYSGAEVVRVGTPIANRGRAELEELIGFMVNTVVVRVEVGAETEVRELLRGVRERCWEAYAHQEAPYEVVVEAVQRERDLSRHGLFEVMFALQQGEVGELELGGLEVAWEEVGNERARYDLTLTLSETEGELEGQLEYRTDLYERERMERLLEHYERVLAGMVGDVEARVRGLKLLSAAEEREQVEEWNETRREFPRESCIQELFEAQAQRRPEAVAVVYGTEQLSYRELNERANQLAHYLMKRGVGPEVVVGVCQERSVELVVSLLGILKAGGVYLPLDPTYPEARRAYMMNDAQAHVLLTKKELAQVGDESKENPERQGWSENLAYVMYTSGSTGEPKGIGVTHRNVLRLVCGAEYAELNEQTVILQLASVSFDAATFELWGALLNGGKLVLYPGRVASAVELGELVREQGVETLWLTSALYNAVVEQGVEELRGLRQLLIGGEALSEGHVRRGLAALEGVELINGYGPTEVTTFSCTHRIRSSAGEEWEQGVPIGKPINNTEAYVLDERQELVPVGVVGELYLGGEGLARGYVGAAELTSEKFVPHPFSQEAGARLYRTGDLVRYRRDGELEFVGRVDEQLKIRGFRIEPGEVESVLREHEQVAEAVVLGRQEENGEKRLVAYVVMKSNDALSMPTAQQLREYLKESLPEYMIPAGFVYLDELPLNANGKLDRAALPLLTSGREDSYVAPRTPVEELLAEIWSQVLGIPTVGIHDNFFEIGGHSLKAAQVTSRIFKECRARITVRDLFESPTIAGLSEVLRSVDDVEEHGLQKVEEQPFYELSPTQKLIWAGSHFGHSGIYNVPAAYLFEEPVNFVSLENALQAIIRRHESLRTTIFLLDGEPKQKIHADIEFKLRFVDLSTDDHRETKARELANHEAATHFNLATGPLLRATLIRLSSARYVFLLTMHHIISDGWSLTIFMKELLTFYAAYQKGVDLSLPPLKIQYTDYVAWQDQLLRSEEIAEDRDYWLNQFAGKLPVLQLPTDYPRPSVKRFNGEVCIFTLDKNLTDSIGLFCRQQGVTLFMSLLAAVYALLHRYTGQEDIILGSPISGRTHKDLEGQIGLYLNLLALRLRVQGEDSFAALVQDVRETTLSAFEHHAYPFAFLVKELNLERNVGRSLLINAGVTLQNHNVVTGFQHDDDFRISRFEQDISSSEYDLWFLFSESDQEIVATVNYNTDLFKRETIELMWSRLVMLFIQVTNDPECKLMDLEISASEHEPDEDLSLAIELNF